MIVDTIRRARILSVVTHVGRALCAHVSLSLSRARTHTLTPGHQGLPPPGTEAEADALVAEAFREIDADSSGDVSLAEFEGFVCGVLAHIAAGLRRTPVVIESATFDGDLIRRLLKDEDAPGTMALMCAELFEELDVDKSGKLSNVELRPLLEGLAEKMDVPPASPESVAFFDAVFEAADWNGDRELEPSEFADLIKGMLEVIADRLAENPITVTKSSTAEVDVFDGTLLKALLADEGAAGGAFKEAVAEQFKALDQNGARTFADARNARDALAASACSGRVPLTPLLLCALPSAAKPAMRRCVGV